MSDLEIKKTYGLFDNRFNKKLIADLKQGGEELLVFPTVRANKTDLSASEKNWLENLSAFEWLILTDVFAADYFIESLSELEIDFYELDALTVCALGEAVADRLRFVQVHADVIPSKTADDLIFSAISNYAGADLKDVDFLVVREKNASLALIEMLRKENAAVEELAVYTAGFAEEAELTRFKTLLAGGAVDEIVFSTPEDLLSLKFLLSGADVKSVLNETRISATSDVVYQSLQENGFRPLYFHHK